MYGLNAKNAVRDFAIKKPPKLDTGTIPIPSACYCIFAYKLIISIFRCAYLAFKRLYQIFSNT